MLGNTCSQAYWHEASWMTKRPKIRTKKRGFHCRSCWQRGAELGWGKLAGMATCSWDKRRLTGSCSTQCPRITEVKPGKQRNQGPELTAVDSSGSFTVCWCGMEHHSQAAWQVPLQGAGSVPTTSPKHFSHSPSSAFVQPWCRQTEMWGSVPASSGRTTCLFQQGTGKWRQTRSAKQTALGQPEIGNGMKAPWPCSEPCCLPRFPLLLFQLTCRYPIVIFEMKVHSDRAVTGCLFNHESLDQMVFCCNVIAWCQGFTQDLYSSSSAGHFLARRAATCWEMAIKEKKDLA